MPFDEAANKARVDALRRRGVDVWGAERVYVDGSVRLDAIEPGAIIRQASLSGPRLSIASGAEIGTSGHAEVEDCQIGPGVELGSGLYRGATMLEGVKIRGFAEIRPDTLLEEHADIAHSVALKNATFTACCVAGSLINFCDLFLSGGTSREDHTEVGSGAVHYNFDPRGDKWGSLIGGIRGVLMRSEPVFVGGNCGLVGPVEIGLGAVTAAASTVRKDVPESELNFQSARPFAIQDFDRHRYGAMTGRFRTSAKLVATLHALDTWYRMVRIPHAETRETALYEAARGRIRAQVQERIDRLGRIAGKLQDGLSSARDASADASIRRDHERLAGGWPEFRKVLEEPAEPASVPGRFVNEYARARGAGRSHLEALRESEAGAQEAERWLENIVVAITGKADASLGYEGS